MVERRLLGGKFGQRRRLPGGRRRVDEALCEVDHLLAPHPRTARRVSAESGAGEQMLRRQVGTSEPAGRAEGPSRSRRRTRSRIGSRRLRARRRLPSLGPLRNRNTSPIAISVAKRRTNRPSNSSSLRSGVHGPASPGPTRATPCLRNTSAYDRIAGPAEICQITRCAAFVASVRPHRGTASSIASSRRFSSLPFG